jgi:hypothetical protein
MSTTACSAAGLFFPRDVHLGLRAESYSPWILERLEWAGGNHESFQTGVQAVWKMLEFTISVPGLQALTERLGRERAALRDADVEQFPKGDLQPLYTEPPTVAAVSLDGGRAQIRAPDAPRGVHEPSWTETKVADLVTYRDASYRLDPQPKPPAKFLDPPKVLRLAQEMKGFSGRSRADGRQRPESSDTGKRKDSRKARKRANRRRKVRTVVATTESAEQFGPMVVTEAMRRGFFGAKKKAALGDGSVWIWGIVATHLVGFTPILDFVHLLVHLFSASQAAHKGAPAKAWNLYSKLLKLAWAGHVANLLELLRKHAERLGHPPKDCSEDDPRKILWGVLDYVEKNKDKLDYPRYRRDGLPVSSAPVESLIKRVNRRVKGTEKFWTRAGLEAVLQVRAAYLSEDGRGEAHWAHRPLGRVAGRSLFGQCAAA